MYPQFGESASFNSNVGVVEGKGLNGSSQNASDTLHKQLAEQRRMVCWWFLTWRPREKEPKPWMEPIAPSIACQDSDIMLILWISFMLMDGSRLGCHWYALHRIRPSQHGGCHTRGPAASSSWNGANPPSSIFIFCSKQWTIPCIESQRCDIFYIIDVQQHWAASPWTLAGWLTTSIFWSVILQDVQWRAGRSGKWRADEGELSHSPPVNRDNSALRVWEG